jgi:hypothetical protein
MGNAAVQDWNMKTFPPVVMDLEVTRNTFLIGFQNVTTGNIRQFVMTDSSPIDAPSIRQILANQTVITFNGTTFDLPLLCLALQPGMKNDHLKQAANLIIERNYPQWKTLKEFGINIPKQIDHIDLISVAPGVASLKIYGARLHCKTLLDMPVDHTAYINEAELEIMKSYNRNDLEITRQLYDALRKPLDLREEMSREYGVDLRSRSDAQIAEVVINQEVHKLTQSKHNGCDVVGQRFSFKTPSYIKFKTPELQKVLETVSASIFTVPESGHVPLPNALAQTQIKLGTSIYQLGIGGLHSTEQSISHFTTDQKFLVDRDVVSYYPMIILNQRLSPRHLGDAFTVTFKNILERRLEAKNAGNNPVAESLKITVNGSFGKLGSKYSNLFAPDLLIQTTLTGQLTLLMLIEALELEGIPVVSANTDGVVIKCPTEKAALMEFVIWEWEQKTSFKTEATYYKALYSRDVNNYIALLRDGMVKRKGIFSVSGLRKNPTNEICIEAVTEFIRNGTPVEKTICEAKDIRRFVTVRSVSGGAEKDGVHLGKAIRWYYAKNVDGVIRYKVNQHTVPRTEGAKPLMELPESFPEDVNFDWYITEANSILRDIGAISAEALVS